MTFLNDAPAPREFWARRQAHETTIHMVDALAASLGRVPTADEAGIGPPLAVDGIDELLRGFFTRGRSKLYDGTDYGRRRADGRRSTLDRRRRRTSDRRARRPAGRRRGRHDQRHAAELYLALWNRGAEVVLPAVPDVLERWRATQRVTWS